MLEALILSWLLEAGVNNSNFVMHELENVYKQNMYIELQIDIEFYGFFVGGSNNTYILKDIGIKTFSPYMVEFNFNAGYRYENIELGFKHYCTHPILTYTDQADIMYEGGYDEFYLRISNYEN